MTNADYTAICLLIDQSGSMFSIKSATEESINGFIQEQVSAPGRRTIRIMTFNGGFGQGHILHETCPSTDVDKVEQAFILTPGGSTPLLDAMGETIGIFGDELAAMAEADRPGHVVFAIMTDGQENSSTEFSWPQVKEMVETQKNSYNWDVLYLGANQDAIVIGGHLGIGRDSSLTYTASGAGVKRSGEIMTSYVASASMGITPEITDEQRKDSMTE